MKDKKKNESESRDLVSASQTTAVLEVSQKAAIIYSVILLMALGVYISDARREKEASLLGYRGRFLIALMPFLAVIWEVKKYYDFGLFNTFHASVVKKMPKKELTEPLAESKQTVIPLNRNAAFRQQQAAHRQLNKNTKKSHGICSRLYSKLFSMISDCFSASRNKAKGVLQDQLPDESKTSAAKEKDKNINHKSRNQRKKTNFSKSINQSNLQKNSPYQAEENKERKVLTESNLTVARSSTRTILTETSSGNDSESESEIQEYISTTKSSTNLPSIKPALLVSSSSCNTITPASLEEKENPQDSALHQVLEDIQHIKETINSLKQTISTAKHDYNNVNSSAKSEETISLTNTKMQQAVQALELKYESLKKQIESSQSLINNQLVDKKSDASSVNNEQDQSEIEDFKKTVSSMIISSQHLATMANPKSGGQSQADNVRYLGNRVINFLSNPQFKIPRIEKSDLPSQQLSTRNVF